MQTETIKMTPSIQPNVNLKKLTIMLNKSTVSTEPHSRMNDGLNKQW